MAEVKRKNGAFLVAAGIFLSRIAGLVRERVFAHYFGNSDAGDAFKAALKIPNFLQNLFGEGVLSASFIPVYAHLMAEGNLKEARKVAGAVFSLLALTTSLLVLAGVWATPYLIMAIAPGFPPEKKELTVHLVQIFFPGTGLLVLSAWCLGVLNSHRKFFLSYSAPVLWNVAIIAALVFFGGKQAQEELALSAAYGLVLGSALQFFVQLPTTLRLLQSLPLQLGRGSRSVVAVIRNFVPVVLARGVVQVSAYIDNLLASFLPTGAVSSLAYAQMIYLLPVSLFGMSVSASELPEMSSELGDESVVAGRLRARLVSALERIAFFVVPSAAAFLVLGDLIVGALYQSGVFSRENTVQVWIALAGSTVGLLAATMGRLYSSAFYALRDTRTPLRYAIVRVALTSVLGYVCALRLPALLHFSFSYGTVGLTASAGVAGWVEFFLLQTSLRKRIGGVGLSLKVLGKLWVAALAGALPAFFLKAMLPSLHPVAAAAAVLLPFGFLYLLFCRWFSVGEKSLWFIKLRR